MSEKYALKKDFDALYKRYEAYYKDANKLFQTMADKIQAWDKQLGKRIAALEQQHLQLKKSAKSAGGGGGNPQAAKADKKKMEQDLMRCVDKALIKYDKAKKRR